MAPGLPRSATREALAQGAGALPWVVLGVGASKRTRELQAARARLQLPQARLLEWRELLQSPQRLEEALAQPCVLKLEPPGDDAWAHHQLLSQGLERLGRPPRPPLERGELAAGDAWFTGFEACLQSLDDALATRPHVQVVNAPRDILAMTDKLRCQQRLQAQAVATPPLLGAVRSHDEFIALLDHHGLDRAFLKARYGSSAAGVVAYRRTRGGRQQATTSARLLRGTGAPRLFNDKRLSRYERPADIAAVVDGIAAQGAYAEAWLPKPRCGAGHFDLRLLALAGQAAHEIARASERPMTNLHLDSRRVEPTQVLDPAALQQARATAEAAARAFPHSRVIGFDLVPQPGGARVLEANAFGDLLPGLLWQGLDPHAALCTRWPAAA